MELDPHKITPRDVMREQFNRKERTALFIRDVLSRGKNPDGWPSTLAAIERIEGHVDLSQEPIMRRPEHDEFLTSDAIIAGL